MRLNFILGMAVSANPVSRWRRRLRIPLSGRSCSSGLRVLVEDIFLNSRPASGSMRMFTRFSFLSEWVFEAWPKTSGWIWCCQSSTGFQ